MTWIKLGVFVSARLHRNCTNFPFSPTAQRKPSHCASVNRLKRLQKKATSAICNQTRLDVTSESNLLQSHDTRSVSSGEAFGLTHSLILVSLLASRSVMFSFGGLKESPHPSGKTGSPTEVRVQAGAQIKPTQCLQNVITSEYFLHTQTCPKFRGVCPWEDSIWQAYRNRESVSDVASSHCQIIIHAGQTLWSIQMEGSGMCEQSRLCAPLFTTWMSSWGFFFMRLLVLR